MTIKRKGFSPETLLSAPRRSAATPSPDGRLALYSVSTYSFSNHSRTNELRVLDIATGESTTLTKDGKVSEPNWLGDGDAVVWLRQGENGNTSFIVSEASDASKSYCAGTVAGPVSNLKTYLIRPGHVAMAVAGSANPDGSLYNEKDESKKHTSARLYDSLFVRHWDKYITPQKTSIFTAVLQKSQPHVSGRDGMYHVRGFRNALHGTGLESPIPPFGGTDNFDIGLRGLVLVAKDPELDPATHTKCNCYFLPRDDLMDLSPPQPVKLAHEGLQGASTCPVISPDGSSVAVLQMREDGYEADRNYLCFYHGLDSHGFTHSRVMFLENPDAASVWDRSPNSIMWSTDASSILLTAEDTGCNCLFELKLNEPENPPTKLTFGGSITNISHAASNSTAIFVSGNSLIDNSAYLIVYPEAPQNTVTVSSHTQSGSLFGLSPSQVESLWWAGAEDHAVHAWMIKPSFFKKGEKYPLAYLIHGGPQGAWLDQWSTRWNPAVFAEQGYVVVCPNPTGSTGYGQAFTDGIQNEWGGRPYEDLARGFDYIKSSLDYVDTHRAVALGASYGGYMVNWINGHDLGRHFKALVCHDGVFSMSAQLASEEQYFPVHDLGGPLWDRQAVYDRWDPSRFAKHWETPQLVIHNDLDYRLTVAEGLSAFNVLQMKGIESLMLNFPDENHWVLKPENSLLWHEVVISWINKFVGLPPLLDRDGDNPLEKVIRTKP